MFSKRSDAVSVEMCRDSINIVVPSGPSLQERHGEKTVEARGLLAQIDFEFVVRLVLRKLFGEANLLSDML